MNPLLFPFDLPTVLQLLNAILNETLTQQEMSPASPAVGGWINPEHGLEEPGSAPAVMGAVWCNLWALKSQKLQPALPEDQLLHHAQAAVHAMLRSQDEMGLFDLRSCNYSSSPDAGFAVHRLGLGMLLIKPFIAGLPEWQPVYQQCASFIKLAVDGIKTGGFHTPNHRWVICGALSIAKQLMPHLDVEATIQSYLAEGIDVDPDGAYSEHSTGVYDAICNLCLLLTAEFGHPEVLPAVKANLRYNLHMIDANGEAETGLSLRQDHGERPVPLDLGAAYLYYHSIEETSPFAAMAKTLWEGKEKPGLTDLLWLAFLFHRKPVNLSDTAAEVQDFTCFFPHNRFWRMRKGEFSATAYADRHNLLTANHGSAHLKALSISQSYFGVGRFLAETIESQKEGILLISSGENHAVHRPGYDLPLGREVEDFYASRDEREWRKLSPARSTLSIQPDGQGVSLIYRTIDNHPNVLAQIAFDFLPNGIWTCDGCSFQPQAGQVIFLTQGFGTMRYGNDSLKIGPGADAQRYWQMRDTPPAPELVRIIIPLMAPVNHEFTIGYQ